jgi:hypothetical protein
MKQWTFRSFRTAIGLIALVFYTATDACMCLSTPAQQIESASFVLLVKIESVRLVMATPKSGPIDAEPIQLSTYQGIEVYKSETSPPNEIKTATWWYTSSCGSALPELEEGKFYVLFISETGELRPCSGSFQVEPHLIHTPEYRQIIEQRILKISPSAP